MLCVGGGAQVREWRLPWVKFFHKETPGERRVSESENGQRFKVGNGNSSRGQWLAGGSVEAPCASDASQ